MVTTPKQRKLTRLAHSENMRASALKRKMRKPIVLNHLKWYRATLPPARFKHLNVDETYQRVRITTWVNDLIHTIKAGGYIPDPVAIAERPDGSLWIVDGQQRFWAASECGVGLEATIYKVPDPKTDNYATERKLFYVLNRSRGLSPNTRVGAWAGHITVLLQRIIDSKVYPHTISLKSPSSSAYSSPNLVRGVVALLSPAYHNAFTGIDEALGISETLLATRDAQQKAQAFLLLVPRVFPTPAEARMVAVVALARVAAKRWANGVTDVDRATLGRLSRMNVLSFAPTASSKFLPLVENAYDSRWPGKSRG